MGSLAQNNRRFKLEQESQNDDNNLGAAQDGNLGIIHLSRGTTKNARSFAFFLLSYRDHYSAQSLLNPFLVLPIPTTANAFPKDPIIITRNFLLPFTAANLSLEKYFQVRHFVVPAIAIDRKSVV